MKKLGIKTNQGREDCNGALVYFASFLNFIYFLYNRMHQVTILTTTMNIPKDA